MKIKITKRLGHPVYGENGMYGKRRPISFPLSVEEIRLEIEEGIYY